MRSGGSGCVCVYITVSMLVSVSKTMYHKRKGPIQMSRLCDTQLSPQFNFDFVQRTRCECVCVCVRVCSSHRFRLPSQYYNFVHCQNEWVLSTKHQSPYRMEISLGLEIFQFASIPEKLAQQQTHSRFTYFIIQSNTRSKRICQLSNASPLPPTHTHTHSTGTAVLTSSIRRLFVRFRYAIVTTVSRVVGLFIGQKKVGSH